ncbi:hypothetical protein H5P28_12400 [Ruficoccus amylovorans]|uniref:PEP-CTERM sorting domain-containing protein n=1 Tax=Ruficoccus amylovorans TaxID=1804625 RepID=A0A842HFL5_9BACT|nr:hypothetical protein [Ruficoccus amylovorans]MBC2595059.1 hypothetical protein [Ruficoccus amylovorans]
MKNPFVILAFILLAVMSHVSAQTTVFYDDFAGTGAQSIQGRSPIVGGDWVTFSNSTNAPISYGTFDGEGKVFVNSSDPGAPAANLRAYAPLSSPVNLGTDVVTVSGTVRVATLTTPEQGAFIFVGFTDSTILSTYTSYAPSLQFFANAANQMSVRINTLGTNNLVTYTSPSIMGNEVVSYEFIWDTVNKQISLSLNGTIVISDYAMGEDPEGGYNVDSIGITQRLIDYDTSTLDGSYHGPLTVTVNSVPEPATFGIIGGVLLIGFVCFARRQGKAPRQS